MMGKIRNAILVAKNIADQRMTILCEALAKTVKQLPYWISREKSLELIELSSINKVSLV
jgi:hypothetical protein